MLFDVDRETPPSTFPTARVPVLSVPIRFPSTVSAVRVVVLVGPGADPPEMEMACEIARPVPPVPEMTSSSQQ